MNSSHLKSPQPHLTKPYESQDRRPEGVEQLHKKCVNSCFILSSLFQFGAILIDVKDFQRCGILSLRNILEWHTMHWEGSLIWEEIFALCNKVTHWALGAVDSGN